MKELSDFEAIVLLKEIQPLCPNCGKPLRRKTQTPPVESIGSWRQFPQGYRLWCESCSFDHFISFNVLSRLSDTTEINAYYDQLKEKRPIEFEDSRQESLAQYRKDLAAIETQRETVLEAAGKLKLMTIGCRLTYQDNVLYCVRHDNFLENLATAKEALEMLLGFEVKADQLTVEQYRSVG